MSGTLYGVGLGPGDPELITLKAARLIASARVIAYPTLAGAESYARRIAADLISDAAREIVMDVPMLSDPKPAQMVYDLGAVEIAEVLDKGHDVVCLCEGDPLFYGSFMYIFDRLVDRYPVEIVPGITSVSACSAVAQAPLTRRNDRLTILPGPLPEADLSAAIQAADSLAIMKVGRHLPKLRAVIGALGLTDRAIFVARATNADQTVRPLAEAPDVAPYFSMILIRKEPHR